MESITVSHPANTFALRGHDLELGIEPGITGDTTVTIRDRGSQEQRFSGDEVVVEPTRIGTWYTVPAGVHTLQAESISVLIPTVTLWQGEQSVEMHTVAIRTTGGPGSVSLDDRAEDNGHGQRSSYTTLALRGDAALHRT